MKGTTNGETYFYEFYKIDWESNYKFRRNIVQDNARIHHTKLLKEYTVEKHINMRYNPAYSPEFNPIELCFNKVKCDHNNLENDIVTAFNSISSENCLSFYKKVQEIMNSYK